MSTYAKVLQCQPSSTRSLFRSLQTKKSTPDLPAFAKFHDCTKRISRCFIFIQAISQVSLESIRRDSPKSIPEHYSRLLLPISTTRATLFDRSAVSWTIIDFTITLRVFLRPRRTACNRSIFFTGADRA